MKNAVITGASSGIGASLVEKFSRDGWSVTMIARNEEKLKKLESQFHNCKAIVCDLTDTEQVRLACEKINELPVHALINNAGIYQPQSIDEDSDQTWEYHLNGNLMSAVRLTRGLWANLKTSGASILNISSTLGIRPIANTSAYSASKAAMNNWTLSLALEGAPLGVRANAICPGIIDTPIHSYFDSAKPEDKQLHAQLQLAQPLGRTGRVDDISGMALNLCSESSQWITGVLLNIDGGILLNS